MIKKRHPAKKQDNGLDTPTITPETISNKINFKSKKLMKKKSIQEQEECSEDNNPIIYRTDSIKVLTRLQNGSLTEKQARDELDINCLAQRIFNLREKGYSIITEKITIIKDNRKRRIAKYTLIIQEGK